MTLSPEEAARANFYALLARLFYAPPNGALLEALAEADDIDAAGGGLGPAWRELSSAAAAATEAAIKEEYDAAFIGTGKAPVTLYTCAYSIRYSNEAPLAQLRGELSRLGFVRRADSSEPEDHIAALCEVMRHLIAERETELAVQRAFFAAWIQPTAEPLCNAITGYEPTRFYRAVARFAKVFLDLEQEAFQLP